MFVCVYHSQIRICEMDIKCSDIYIYIEQRNIDIRKTHNDFSVQVRNFLLLLRFFDIKREIHILSILVFSSAPPSRATPAQGLHEQAKVNCLLPRQSSTQLTDFFKIPKSSARFRRVMSFALANSDSHLGYCDIFERHVRSVHSLEHLC